MELQIKIIGFLLILLSLLHVSFPKQFNWKNELKPLSLINQQLMYIHTFFIAFVVLLMGILAISSSHELTTTAFGKRISLGLGIFWFVRLLFQFFGYSSKLWRGKKFETTMHVIFSMLWMYLTFIFLYNYFSQV